MTETEHRTTPGREVFALPEGMMLRGVSVLGPETAFAVGYAEVVDPGGETENEGEIFELVVKPPGEIDAVRPVPTAP